MAKTLFNTFTNHLSKLISDHFEESSHFVLGVSGGPDSMALLYLLHQLGQNVLVVHVNYGKRGKESDNDQELVEQMSFQWGVECCSITLDSQKPGGENFQNWARDKRYSIFRDLMHEVKADAIITAHHQDDQIETILQKVFRGSSPETWQGIKTWNGELFRPLLNFSKQQILDFCEAEAVPFRIDESNKSSEFARNFLRQEFATKMDELFPGWKANILTLEEYGKSIEASSQYITNKITSGNSILLNPLSKLPEVLKTMVLKTILDQYGLKGTYSKGMLKELIGIEALQTGKSLKAGNLILTKGRDRIHIQPEKILEELRVTITKADARKGFKNEDISIHFKKQPDEFPALRLEVEKLRWPLMLRHWQEGDIFQPLGLSGHQKISDHLTNRKISTILRKKTLVLCGSDGTIYAIIYPVLAKNNERGAISEMAKCEPTSTNFLTINFT